MKAWFKKMGARVAAQTKKIQEKVDGWGEKHGVNDLEEKVCACEDRLEELAKKVGVKASDLSKKEWGKLIAATKKEKAKAMTLEEVDEPFTETELADIAVIDEMDTAFERMQEAAEPKLVPFAKIFEKPNQKVRITAYKGIK